jgi:peptidoglycan/LPS O-acetylase OafA/YrhL
MMSAGAAVMAFLGIRSSDHAFFSWAVLPYHFTLTFVWFGLPIAWNAPAWSLSAEWIAYFAFPALQAALRWTPSLTLTIALLIAQCACLSAFPDPNWRAVIGFAAGASLFVATKDRALPSWLGMTAAARYHEEHDQKRRAQQIDRMRNITDPFDACTA